MLLRPDQRITYRADGRKRAKLIRGYGVAYRYATRQAGDGRQVKRLTKIRQGDDTARVDWDPGDENDRIVMIRVRRGQGGRMQALRYNYAQDRLVEVTHNNERSTRLEYRGRRSGCAGRGSAKPRCLPAGRIGPGDRRAMSVKHEPASPMDVSLMHTGAAAALIVTGGYVFVVPHLEREYIGQVLINSGWIGWSIAQLGTWSLVILAARWSAVKRRRALLERRVLSGTIAPQITPANAALFLRLVQSRFPDTSAHPLAARVGWALKQLANGHPTHAVVQELRAQAREDDDLLDSGYAMVRAFVWAVPILGFVGTVLGIGQAIGGFSSTLQQAEDLAMVKSSLGHVVSGLAVAFDTTFLGLIVSLVITFPLHLVVRSEQRWARALDDACTRELVDRIRA